MNLNKPLEETPRMNKKSQTETKDLLADTLLSLLESKPFPKITVNELCTKSMIVRSTFYLHFHDKYELLSYCLNRISKEWDAVMEARPPKDFFIVFLNTCEEKGTLFCNLFQTDNAELIELFYQFINRHIAKCLNEKASKGSLLPGPVDSVSAFYGSGLIGMTMRWIKSNYNLPKEVLAACQFRLLKDIL